MAQAVSTNSTQSSQGKRPILLLVVGIVAGIVLSVVTMMALMFRGNGGYSSFSTYNEMPIYKESDSLSQSVGSAAPDTKSTLIGNAIDRTITKNYLTSHVKDTTAFSAKVEASVTSVKGKVMSNNVTDSTDGKTSYGTMRVLVPNAKVETVLTTIKNESIKIVDKQITSYEITQEYTDLGRQLAQLEETYAKLKKIYDKAQTVTDILTVQKELTNVQAEIDSVKGRINALDELSKNTEITIYFSTDEFALPYVPEGTFQFDKTIKLAVRALVVTVDGLLAALIWIAVFSPLVIVPLGVIWIVMKFARRKNNK